MFGRKHQVAATLSSCTAQFVTGMTLSYSSPTIPDLEKSHILNTSQSSWFGSIVCIGAALGSLIGGLLVEKQGRKTTIIYATAPSVVGWWILTYYRTAFMLCVGRGITGISMGISTVTIPLYIAETVSSEHRGFLGSVFQLSANIGILGTFLLGIFLDWQWLALIAIFLTTCTAVSMVFMPESPRWLLREKRRLEGIKSLQWLRDSPEVVDQELTEIEDALTQQIKEVKASFSDYKRRSVYMPLLVSGVLLLFQQFSAINIVTFYAKSLFLSAGFSHNPNLPLILVGLFQVFGTSISCYLTDRVGRKPLLIFSSVVVVISSCTLGLYYYLNEVKNSNLPWLSLLSVITFVVAFAIGIGTVPFVVISEITPLRTRGLTSSICGIGSWLANFLITKEVFALEAVLTRYGTFWLCGGLGLAYCFFIILMVPETKGKTLEEIEKYYEN